ncbi:hypothetical protein TrCOL_g1937, partial [Triparma columacea]
ETIGVKLNPAKSKMLGKDCDTMRKALKEKFGDLDSDSYKGPKIGVVDGQDWRTAQYGEGVGIVFMGVPIGDRVFQHWYLMKKTAQVEEELDQIALMQLGESQQLAAMSLRCFQGKLQHIMQCLPPYTMRPYCQRLDVMVRKTLGQAVAQDLNDLEEFKIAQQRLGLPVRWGGVGQRNQVDVALAAFLGGMCLVGKKFLPDVVNSREGVAPWLEELVGEDAFTKDKRET